MVITVDAPAPEPLGVDAVATCDPELLADGELAVAVELDLLLLPQPAKAAVTITRTGMTFAPRNYASQWVGVRI